MMEDASLSPTEEPIQEVEEWIGSALIRRTLSTRNEQEEATIQQTMPIKECTEEEYAVETGCTFRLRYIIPVIEDRDQLRKVNNMRDGTTIFISTLDRPLAWTKTKAKSDLVFTVAKITWIGMKVAQAASRRLN